MTRAAGARLFALAALLVTSAPASADDAGTGVVMPAADAPTVAARLDRDKVLVGEVLTVTVTAVAPRQVAVNLPTNLSLSSFELLDRQQSEADLGDGRMRREFQLHLAAFEPGELTVPSIELTYLGKGGAVLSVATEPLEVQVVSVLANEPEPALKQDAGPVRVFEDVRWPLYVLAGLIAAALGILIGMFVARRMRARLIDRPAPPPRPAHEVAFDKLDRLSARGLEEGDDNRPFYFELSEIIREYLGGRYGFDSLECTTDELMGELRRRAPREVVMGEVEGWLLSCDLVKFAKISPTAAEARGALETAIRIVSSTRPRPVATAASVQGGGHA